MEDPEVTLARIEAILASRQFRNVLTETELHAIIDLLLDRDKEPV